MNLTPEILASSPEYISLQKKRHAIIWPLLIATVAAYMFFILAIAFAPKALATQVGDGVISYGILLGLGLIFFNFLITMVYVYRCNREIEPLIKQLHARAGVNA